MRKFFKSQRLSTKGKETPYWQSVQQRLFDFHSISLLLYCLLVQTVNAVHFFTQTVIKENWFVDFLTAFFPFTFVLWLLPALFGNKWIRRSLAWIEVLFLSLLFIYEYHLLVDWQTPITNSVIMHFLTPNGAEANAGYFPSGISWHSWLGGILILFSIAAFVCGRKFLLRFLQYLYKLTGVGGYIVLFALLFWGFVVQRQSKFYSIDTEDPISYNRLVMPERFAIASRQAFDEIQEMGEVREKLCAIPLDNQSVSPRRKLHNVVLIVGESLRRMDMHCYGYPLDNTPRIDSLCSTGRMVLYDDVVSCAPNTNTALKTVLTYHYVEGEGEWYDYAPLPRAFSAAGYHTRWSSNQEKGGIFIQHVATIASTCDSTFYTEVPAADTWIWGDREPSYDEAVLPLLASTEQFGRPLLQVVHLIGNHEPFSSRYPKHFSRFSSADVPEDRVEWKRQATAEYMNSIYYNDYVVGEVIKRYEDTPTIVVYFSDHGLVRYDDDEYPNTFGHANTPSALQIPFMVYMTPRFVEENPDVYQKVQSARNKPFMTDLLPYSLTSLLGIHNRYTHPALALWSDQYNYARKREVKMWRRTCLFDPLHIEYQQK